MMKTNKTKFEYVPIREKTKKRKLNANSAAAGTKINVRLRKIDGNHSYDTF